MGTKKTLYFLHETDDRTLVLIEDLHSSTIHRPTSLFYTILNDLYTCRDAENACKTNENNEKHKNTQQISDTISTSISEGDIKAHFTNETSKKFIFNSDSKAIEV